MSLRVTQIHTTLAVIFLTALVGLAFPYGFPLFLPLVVGYFMLFLVTGRLQVRLSEGLLVLYVCILFYGLGILLGGGTVYINNRLDLANILSIFLLSLMFCRVKREQYRRFIDAYHNLAVPVFFALSVLSLLKFYFNFRGTALAFLAARKWGSSLVMDYNMFAYAMLLGLIAAVYSFTRHRSPAWRIFSLGTVITIASAIIFSGSRRGLAALSVILAGLLVMALIHAFKKHNISRGAVKTIGVLLLAAVLLTAVPACFDISSVPLVEKIEHRLSQIPGHRQLAGIMDRPFEDYLATRMDSWKLALDLIKEYSARELLIGSGFEYLEIYGAGKRIVEEDYPHNWILSAVHYSGLVGALFVTLLLLLPFVCLYRYRDVFGLNMFGLYALSLSYLMPSSNSVFSFKVMLLLMLIIFSVSGNTVLETGIIDRIARLRAVLPARYSRHRSGGQ